MLAPPEPMEEAPVAAVPRAPAPRVSPLKDTLVVTTWDDPPPPAPEVAQTLPRRPTSIIKTPTNGDIPNTNSMPRRPHSIAVTSAANNFPKSVSQVPLYRAPTPPSINGQQPPIRRPNSIASTPTGTVPNNGIPFKAVNGFPHWPGQKPPIVTRRPHSVATTPINGTPNPAELSPRNVPWNGIHNPLPRRPHSIAVTEAEGDGCWTPPRIPPIQHPIARRPSPSAMPGYPMTLNWPSTTHNRRPHSITSGTLNSMVVTSASPSDSGYRSLPSSQSDYQVQTSMANGLPPNDPRRLQGSALAQLRPSPTFHGLPFKPFNCGASNGVPLFLGCTHAHGSRTGTPATTPSKTASSTPSSIREAVQHLLMQPRNGFKIMDDKVSLFIDIMDAQERFSQVKY